MTKLNIAISGLAVIGLAAVVVLAQRAQTRLRAENRALQSAVRQLTQRGVDRQSVVAQPQSNASLPEEEMRELLRMRGQVGVLRQEQKELDRLRADNRRLHTNWVDHLLGGKKLSLQEVAPYLEAKQRNPQSLLAAFRATGDPSLLREAVDKYPDDPGVNFSALFQSSSPAERRQRLDAFKQSAPDNALANYLSAQDYFKTGLTEQAVEELAVAAGKPNFQDYSGNFVDNLEDVYATAGCSTTEAKAVAAFSLALPQFAELRGLGQSLADLANRYSQAGDAASAQVALQMGVALGRRVGEPAGQNSVIQDLVGIAIERNLLAAVDPGSPYDSAGHTVKDRIEELTRFRQTIKEVAGGDGVFEVLHALSEQDQIRFFDRMKASGELEALRWARNLQGKP